MDPLYHLMTTAVLLDHKPATLLGAIAPDLPWYVLYPAWLVSRGQLASTLRSSEWPLPPHWMREIHYASHSLLTVAAVWAFSRSREIRMQGSASLSLAWLLHILLDLPTHSRQRMAPRPFWPLSRWAYDGFSWADHITVWLAQRSRKRP
ncbi:MAG: hypothetical protein U9R48_00325 [Chloroflexota bacterium]|nr:hypothetical protein [Chloroflexota bacterium]